MFVCYLDDSGKDPQNRITTVAGYVARDTAWEAFEQQGAPIFDHYEVPVLHAKQLHDTDACFKGWSVIKKQTFVSEICGAMTPHVALGVSMSALKETYKGRAKTSKRKRTNTPYTFCFNVILDWLLRDPVLGGPIRREGLSFILEAGHENNAEAEQCFSNVRELFKPELENVLRSMAFVGKKECRAIQMADLIAFYSRRHGVAMEKAPLKERASVSPATMMNIIGMRVPIRAYVATDFDAGAGSRFLAGDPSSEGQSS